MWCHLHVDPAEVDAALVAQSRGVHDVTDGRCHVMLFILSVVSVVEVVEDVVLAAVLQLPPVANKNAPRLAKCGKQSQRHSNNSNACAKLSANKQCCTHSIHLSALNGE
jgi:hypothetical protein